MENLVNKLFNDTPVSFTMKWVTLFFVRGKTVIKTTIINLYTHTHRSPVWLTFVSANRCSANSPAWYLWMDEAVSYTEQTERDVLNPSVWERGKM